MQVKIKTLNVGEMQVKSKGIEFEVRQPGNDGAQIGDCYLTMTGLTWCVGKTQKKNGIQITWNDFKEIMKSKNAMQAAIKAAKDI